MKRTAFLILAALSVSGVFPLLAQDAPARLRHAFPTATPSPSPEPTAKPTPVPKPTTTPTPTPPSTPTPVATPRLAETPAPVPRQTPTPAAPIPTPATEPRQPRAQPQPTAFPKTTPAGAAATRPRGEHPEQETGEARAERKPAEKAERDRQQEEKKREADTSSNTSAAEKPRAPLFRRASEQPTSTPGLSRPTFDLGATSWRVNSTIRSLEQRWQDAVKAHDADALEKLLDDDFVATSVTGQKTGKQGILSRVRDDKNTYRTARAQKMKLRTTGSRTIVVEGIISESGTKEDGERFDNARRFTDTWTLRGDEWKCVSSVTASLEPEG